MWEAGGTAPEVKEQRIVWPNVSPWPHTEIHLLLSATQSLCSFFLEAPLDWGWGVVSLSQEPVNPAESTTHTHGLTMGGSHCNTTTAREKIAQVPSTTMAVGPTQGAWYTEQGQSF